MADLITRITITISLLLLPAAKAMAGEGGPVSPERTGMAMVFGHSYDPSPTFPVVQVSGLLQYDYDKVWPHRAPEELYFKVEGSLGAADLENDLRFIGSINILAQHYLRINPGDGMKPYLEAGIGLIYTDFQVSGQGLRFNFNPQAGIGCDLETENDDWYVNLRIHHLSNGGLDDDNRGINSLLFQVGRYF